MGLDRIRNALTTFVWYHIFYFIIVVIFFIGFDFQQCGIFWADRLYIFLVIPVVTAITLAVSPGNWWARFFHGIFTLIIMIFFTVLFFAYLLPGYVTANCQPAALNISGVCSNGKCTNPFNDVRWSCIYGNTSEGQLCETYPCVGNLCEIGVSPADLDVKFGHFWIFVFVIIFIILMCLSLLLLRNINLLIRRAKQEIKIGVDNSDSLGEELRDIENIYPYIPGVNVYGDVSHPHDHENAYYETKHDAYLERNPNLSKTGSFVGGLIGTGNNNKKK